LGDVVKYRPDASTRCSSGTFEVVFDDDCDYIISETILRIGGDAVERRAMNLVNFGSDHTRGV